MPLPNRREPKRVEALQFAILQVNFANSRTGFTPEGAAHLLHRSRRQSKTPRAHRFEPLRETRVRAVMQSARETPPQPTAASQHCDDELRGERFAELNL